MPTREELKALIDQMPEDQLASVEAMLLHRLNPPKPMPEFEAMMSRSQEYRQQVMRRFQETGRSGTRGGIGSGGGSFGGHEGRSSGRWGTHYWDDKALVEQSTQHFSGHEIEVMERLSISEGRSLCCAIELSSGGKTVRFSEEFPLRTA
jgi:hypothetical protein